MPDPADYANETAADDLARTIKNARSVGANSHSPLQGTNHLCEDCGDSIPRARRKAVPGCTRCVTCQTKFERANRNKINGDEDD